MFTKLIRRHEIPMYLQRGWMVLRLIIPRNGYHAVACRPLQAYETAMAWFKLLAGLYTR